jgi:uncharacterized protein involved in exopolysaccharide biosynthesis
VAAGPESSGAAPEFDLAQLASLVLERWRTVSVVTLLVTAAVIAASYVVTPAYRGAVVVAPARAQGSLSGGGLGSLGSLASLAGISLGGNGQSDEALAVLRSRSFIQQFISRHQLLPALYPDLWRAEQKQWKVSGDDVPTLGKAAKSFAKKLTVTPDRRSGLVTVAFDFRDRQLAADWANALIADLNEEMRQRAAERSDENLRFLRGELGKTTMLSAQEALSRLIESQTNERMLANVSGEYMFRIVDGALPAERNDRERPNRILWSAVGILAGLLAGVLAAALGYARDGRRAQAHAAR